MENMTRAPQEKFASLKGNPASTALNQSDQGRSSGLSFFATEPNFLMSPAPEV
jgi:hypothetical protein